MAMCLQTSNALEKTEDRPMPVLDRTADLVIGFAFDIERDPNTTSKFKPADEHLGSENPNPLYATPRLEGYAAMLRLGFTRHLLIPGKDERRYKGETVEIDGKPSPLWQGLIIRKMLIEDYGIKGVPIEWIPSTGSTRDAAIAAAIELRRRNIVVAEGRVEFVTSWYHVDRPSHHLREAGLLPLITSAETFPIAEAILKGERNEALDHLRSFGGHYLDQRVRDEIGGTAELLLGTYERKTKGW